MKKQNISSKKALKANINLKEDGLLVLNAHDLFRNTGGWENLKGILTDPTKLTKVILTGPEWLYPTLSKIYPEFNDFFKVHIKLNSRIDNTEDTRKEFISKIAKFCTENKYKHISSEGAATLIQYATKIAGSQERLSLDDKIYTIIKEADREAAKKNDAILTENHIKEAIKKESIQNNSLENEIRKWIDKNSEDIETCGERIGQLNDLDTYMASPIKIIALYNKDETTNSDNVQYFLPSFKETSNKIIENMIKKRYSSSLYMNDTNKNATFNCKFLHKSFYSLINGDGVSSAGLYTILSRIGQFPLDQSIVVAGRVNQHMGLEAVDELNEKIESFYKICKTRGFTGEQGVVIPKANEKDLVLSEELVDSTKKGEFHVYAISRIEEGFEVLAGLTMDEVDKRVIKNLKNLSVKKEEIKEYEKKCSPPSLSTLSKKKSMLLNQGFVHYRKNKLSIASDVFKKILKKDTNNKQALFFLGKINLEKKDLVQAVKYLRAAEIQDPTNIEILNELGFALEQFSQQMHKVKISKRLKEIIKYIIPSAGYIFDYEENEKLKGSLEVHLHWEAQNKWKRALEIETDNVEALINLAFSKQSGAFSKSDIKKHNNTDIPYSSKNLWERILKIDTNNALADYKINEYKLEYEKEKKRRFALCLEGLIDSKREDALKKIKTHLFDSDYGKKARESLQIVKDIQAMEKLSLVDLPFNNKTELKSFLKICKNYKKGLPLEEAIWQFYKNGMDTDILFTQLFLLKSNLLPCVKKQEMRIESTYLKTGNLLNLIEDLKELEKVYPKNYDIKIALSKLYSQRGKDLRVKEKLSEVMQLIEKESKDSKGILCMHPYGKSKNDVKVLTYNYFLNNIFPPLIFVFKRSKNIGDFKKEKKAVEFIEKINKERELGLKLPKVLSYTEFEDYCNILMEGAVCTPGSIFIEDVYSELCKREKPEATSLLKKVTEETAKIHAHIPDNILQKTHIMDKKKNDKHYYKRIKQKFFGSFKKVIQQRENNENNINQKGIQEYERKFFEDYSVILDIISNLKPGVYKDVIFKNFLVDDKNNLITIDFETLRNTPYQMDLATAFECENFVSDNDSDENSRKNLLKVYVQKFNEQVEKYDLPKEKIENLEKFEKDYYACAIQRALIHYGSFSSIDNPKNCIEFIKKAIWNAGKLKTYYNDTSLEYQKLCSLEKRLIVLLNIAEVV